MDVLVNSFVYRSGLSWEEANREASRLLQHACRAFVVVVRPTDHSRHPYSGYSHHPYSDVGHFNPVFENTVTGELAEVLLVDDPHVEIHLLTSEHECERERERERIPISVFNRTYVPCK